MMPAAGAPPHPRSTSARLKSPIDAGIFGSRAEGGDRIAAVGAARLRKCVTRNGLRISILGPAIGSGVKDGRPVENFDSRPLPA
jgi:hypothetical protein